MCDCSNDSSGTIDACTLLCDIDSPECWATAEFMWLDNLSCCCTHADDSGWCMHHLLSPLLPSTTICQNLTAIVLAFNTASNCHYCRYFGVQFFSECWAGNDLTRAIRYGQKTCNAPCRGDAKDMCGDSLANSLYQVAESSAAGEHS